MDISKTRERLLQLKEDAAVIRSIIEKETSEARLLIDRDVHTEFNELLAGIENNISISETKWRMFGLMGFGMTKMKVWKKFENANGEDDDGGEVSATGNGAFGQD